MGLSVLSGRGEFRWVKTVFRLHIDLYLHAGLVGTTTPIDARQGNRLFGRTSHRNPDQVTVSHNAIDGIKLDPSGARQVNLTPSVCRAAAKPSGAVSIGNVNITRDKTSSESHQAG